MRLVVMLEIRLLLHNIFFHYIITWETIIFPMGLDCLVAERKICMGPFERHRGMESQGVSINMNNSAPRWWMWSTKVTYKSDNFFSLRSIYTVTTVYSWSIANNFVIGFYCRCLEILCQIALSSVANYFRPYRKKQFGIKSVGIYSRHL